MDECPNCGSDCITYDVDKHIYECECGYSVSARTVESLAEFSSKDEIYQTLNENPELGGERPSICEG